MSLSSGNDYFIYSSNFLNIYLSSLGTFGGFASIYKWSKSSHIFISQVFFKALYVPPLHLYTNPLYRVKLPDLCTYKQSLDFAFSSPESQLYCCDTGTEGKDPAYDSAYLFKHVDQDVLFCYLYLMIMGLYFYFNSQNTKH